MACPSCGVGDTVDNVRREVAEFRKAFAQKRAQQAMRNATPSRKFLKFTPGPQVNHKHRFVVDMRRLRKLSELGRRSKKPAAPARKTGA
jgi:hypothetical protein